MMEQEKTYQSSYLLRVLLGEYNPFRPNIIVVNNHFVEYKKRNWHLISVDTQTFHFQNVVGIDVDKHLIGASLRIVTSGSDKIYVHGFSKETANQIKQDCTKFISMNSQRGTTEALASAIATAVGTKNGSVGGHLSVAEELKKMKELLDSGVISQNEFDTQKNKLLNQ